MRYTLTIVSHVDVWCNILPEPRRENVAHVRDRRLVTLDQVELCSVAGRQERCFTYRLARFEIAQKRCSLARGKRQLFEDLDRGRSVIHTCENQTHQPPPSLSSPKRSAMAFRTLTASRGARPAITPIVMFSARCTAMDVNEPLYGSFTTETRR